MVPPRKSPRRSQEMTALYICPQVGLGAVLGDKYLAVLVRGHGARVNIEIGVKFLGHDAELATLQDGAHGSDGYALANGTNYTTSYKDILWHTGNQILKELRKTFAFLGSIFTEVRL